MSDLTLETLYAQPDGKFRSNEKYDKLLANFSEEEFFKDEKDCKKFYEVPYRKYYYVDCQQAIDIQQFSNDLLAGTALDFNKWQILVDELIKNDGYVRDVLSYHFSQLEKNFETLEHISASDILDMYIAIIISQGELHKWKREVFCEELYQFIQRHSQLKNEILERAKYWREQYSDVSAVEEFLTAIFPIEFDIAIKDIQPKFYKHKPSIFYHDLPKFIRVYFYAEDLSESELLWFIKHHPQHVAQVRGSSISTKREILNILHRFHHENVLKMWINYSAYSNYRGYIKRYWLTRYPLFTLSLLLEHHDSDNIRPLIKTYLTENIAVIKPLQELLAKENKTEEQKALAELTKNISDKQIEQAFNALPKDKKELKKLKPKPQATLKWQEFNLQRIHSADVFEPKYLAIKEFPRQGKYYGSRDLFEDRREHRRTILREYQPFTDEHKILENHYDELSISQRELTLFIKPSVVIAKYDDLIKGAYVLNKDDYIDLNIRYIHSWTDTAFNEVVEVTLQEMDEQHRKILFQNFPFEWYETKERAKALHSMLTHYLQTYGNDALATVCNYMSLLQGHRQQVYSIALSIDSYRTVPYFLGAFFATKYKKQADRYLKKFIKTVIDEVVYIIFTKQTDPLLKKSKKNAKLLWDWLIEHKKSELVASLKEYDTQLEKPLLTDFFERYIAYKSGDMLDSVDSTAKSKLIDKQIDKQDDNGIPTVLLSDDWQRLVNRKKITIPSHVNTHKFPPLVITSTGQPLPDDAFQRLLKMLLLSEFKKPLPVLVDALTAFSKQSQTALADAFWREHVDDNVKVKDDWLMTASAILYDEHLGDKAFGILKYFHGGTARRSIKLMLEVLSESAIINNTPEKIRASKNALRGLVYINQNLRLILNKPALKEIKRYAKKVKVDANIVPDLVLPDLGLDKQGKRIFTANGHSVTLKLDIHLQPIFIDEQGNIFQELPQSVHTEEIQNEWNYIQTALSNYEKSDYQLLEHMMVHQRRLSVSDFSKYYLDNPFLLRIAGQLIWGVYANDTDEQITNAFCVVETGECFDQNDNDINLDKESKIGLVHPLQLNEEQLLHFKQHIADEEIIQPFPQIDRVCYRLTEAEQKIGGITRFKNVLFTAESLQNLANKGWELEAEYGGLGMSYSKYFQGKKRTLSFEKDYEQWASVSDFLDDPQMFSAISTSGFSQIEISEIIAELESLERVES